MTSEADKLGLNSKKETPDSSQSTPSEELSNPFIVPLFGKKTENTSSYKNRSSHDDDPEINHSSTLSATSDSTSTIVGSSHAPHSASESDSASDNSTNDATISDSTEQTDQSNTNKSSDVTPSVNFETEEENDTSPKDLAKIKDNGDFDSEDTDSGDIAGQTLADKTDDPMSAGDKIAQRLDHINQKLNRLSNPSTFPPEDSSTQQALETDPSDSQEQPEESIHSTITDTHDDEELVSSPISEIIIGEDTHEDYPDLTDSAEDAEPIHQAPQLQPINTNFPPPDPADFPEEHPVEYKPEDHKIHLADNIEQDAGFPQIIGFDHTEHPNASLEDSYISTSETENDIYKKHEGIDHSENFSLPDSENVKEKYDDTNFQNFEDSSTEIPLEPIVSEVPSEQSGNQTDTDSSFLNFEELQNTLESNKNSDPENKTPDETFQYPPAEALPQAPAFDTPSQHNTEFLDQELTSPSPFKSDIPQVSSTPPEENNRRSRANRSRHFEVNDQLSHNLQPTDNSPSKKQNSSQQKKSIFSSLFGKKKNIKNSAGSDKKNSTKPHQKVTEQKNSHESSDHAKLNRAAQLRAATEDVKYKKSPKPARVSEPEFLKTEKDTPQVKRFEQRKSPAHPSEYEIYEIIESHSPEGVTVEEIKVNDKKKRWSKKDKKAQVSDEELTPSEESISAIEAAPLDTSTLSIHPELTQKFDEIVPEKEKDSPGDFPNIVDKTTQEPHTPQSSTIIRPPALDDFETSSIEKISIGDPKNSQTSQQQTEDTAPLPDDSTLKKSGEKLSDETSHVKTNEPATTAIASLNDTEESTPRRTPKKSKKQTPKTATTTSPSTTKKRTEKKKSQKKSKWKHLLWILLIVIIAAALAALALCGYAIYNDRKTASNSAETHYELYAYNKGLIDGAQKLHDNTSNSTEKKIYESIISDIKTQNNLLSTTNIDEKAEAVQLGTFANISSSAQLAKMLNANAHNAYNAAKTSDQNMTELYSAMTISQYIRSQDLVLEKMAQSSDVEWSAPTMRSLNNHPLATDKKCESTKEAPDASTQDQSIYSTSSQEQNYSYNYQVSAARSSGTERTKMLEMYDFHQMQQRRLNSYLANDCVNIPLEQPAYDQPSEFNQDYKKDIGQTNKELIGRYTQIAAFSPATDQENDTDSSRSFGVDSALAMAQIAVSHGEELSATPGLSTSN